MQMIISRALDVTFEGRMAKGRERGSVGVSRAALRVKVGSKL